ncbi:MAG: tetratricopeptide repeat protein [Candidatus Riflebacteria bacterium]|nr:tetratricopeptide repeat protein [Candidatus Riflebacteria bacterium]
MNSKNTSRPIAQKFWASMFAIALLLMIFANSSLCAADTPEQVEQYRYALGLIQRHLYEEAGKVLSRILSEPQSFSQSDGALFWLAECEYRQKNNTKAAGLYEKLLKDYPNSIFRDRAAYGLGWSHTNDNNPKSASEAFARVSRNDIPLWIDANLKRGFLMVRYNMDTEQTVRVYEELLKESSLSEAQRFESHLQAGIGKFNQSIYRQALEHFTSALEICPDEKRQPLQFYIAEAHFRLKNYKDAASEYAKTIALAPDSQLGQKSAYSLAWCHIRLGEPDKAIPLFEKQAENKRSAVRAESVKNLVDLLMNLHQYEKAIVTIEKGLDALSAAERPDLAYIRALALSRTGEFEKSLVAFDEFVKKYPRNAKTDEAIYQTGLVNIALSRFKEAIEYFDKISSEKVDPDLREKAIYRIGECWFNLGNIKLAGDNFDKVIKVFPKGKARYDALYQLGELAYMQESHADALTAFEAIAASKNELAAQATFRSGEVLMKAGRHNDAIIRFQEYLNKYPDGKLKEDAIFKIGIAWLELKDRAQALAAFSQLMNAKGYFRQEARFHIGEIARELENYPLAIQHYKAIIAEDAVHPLASRARRAVGISLYQTKDYKGAIDTFAAILKDYPATDAAIPESRLWFGKSLIASGDVENGILEVLKVPVLYPDSEFIAAAYAEAARAYEKLNNINKSRMMYEELLKVKPNADLRQEAETALKKK